MYKGNTCLCAMSVCVRVRVICMHACVCAFACACVCVHACHLCACVCECVHMRMYPCELYVVCKNTGGGHTNQAVGIFLLPARTYHYIHIFFFR